MLRTWNEVVMNSARAFMKNVLIPTPIGDYAPDWAIVMKRDGVKHIFFIAETIPFKHRLNSI